MAVGTSPPGSACESAPESVEVPYLRPPEEILAALASDEASGLTSAEAQQRLSTCGPNVIRGEQPPSVAPVVMGLLRDPVNLMLVAVTLVSLVIGQVPTAIVVALLIVLNLVLGTKQELRARASVDASPNPQVPQSRVLRDGVVIVTPATNLVPGDVIQLEAGDIAPADGRILRSAALQTQESALTGERAPVSKNAAVLAGPEVPLADRTNMVFQDSSVTRGAATVVVTATGMRTQIGQIASMLKSVERTRSPLQRDLDRLTRVLGVIAWTAVAVVVAVAVLREIPFSQVMLLGTAVGISAIPIGMPMFVSGLLSHGSSRLAAAKAVVKNLTDVETVGATSAINTDKTGTLTLNQAMVSAMYTSGSWFSVSGEGYRKVGAIRAIAGDPVPGFTQLALNLCLDSESTVSADGAVVGDPTEAALAVLAAKLGVDAEETRRARPRLAEVPFDSAYKFMAAFHRIKVDGNEYVVALVRGAPEVVLARCSLAGGPLAVSQVPIAEVSANIEAAIGRMAGEGLHVLAFAARVLADDEIPVLSSDPMSLIQGLGFVGMVGIIDPLRSTAKDSVSTALAAGIDVRMITTGHVVTARAIARSLGLRPGVVSGSELHTMTDHELERRLPQLHVFGRVSSKDKLRLTQVMQRQGLIVAMTGDAVNDAAALKQADIGVALGSGSEVSKNRLLA